MNKVIAKNNSTAKHYLEKELEELLRTDMTVWEFVRKSSLDGVWYWDLENPDEEWISDELWEAFGVDPSTKDHKVSEWQDLIFKEDLDVAIENLKKHCDDPDHPYDQVVRYRHADGSTVWVRCRGMAIRDENGVPKRLLGAHNDITALKSREQALARDKQMIEQVNEELKTFAYSVSHDLKAPSNTAHMLLSELSTYHGDTLDDDGREILRLTLASVDRMRNLIEELLRYTRVVGQELVFTPLNLELLVEEVVADLTADIKESRAEVSIGTIPQIEGHRMQVRTLFQNLISNAIKFRRRDEACKVHIEGKEHEDGSISVSVSDNGIGVPEESHERIFALFKRLHGHNEIPGVGLGLSICKRIAISHSAEISVKSAPPDPGATFTVTFPAKPYD